MPSPSTRVLLVLFSTLAACSLDYSYLRHSSTWSSYGLDDFTGSHEVAVACPLGTETLTADYDVACRGGAVEVTLLTPAGECWTSRTCSEPRSCDTLRPTTMAGTWTCRLVFTGFTGDAEVALLATR